MPPTMKRIKMATIAVPDVDGVADLYGKWLGYRTLDRGEVSAGLAASWGAPAMVGRKTVVMQPASKVDVFIRAVAIDPIHNYRPMASWGWGAIEIVVRDPMALNRRLAQSPFAIVGKPRFLNGYPTICAMQVRGPGNEILYLTADTGPREKSLLPEPGADVGRPFIMVQASGSTQRTRDWYAKSFAMKKGPINGNTIDIIQSAQALPPDHPFPLSLMAMADSGNFLELDGYPASTGPRVRNHGQLPPGVAMASFTVKNLDKLALTYLAPPAVQKDLGYDGRRTATTVGPGGELIELIEG
jgi:catechol 2,3-dioxygenase-like lactoylglutathione lyase family enzyme